MSPMDKKAIRQRMAALDRAEAICALRTLIEKFPTEYVGVLADGFLKEREDVANMADLIFARNNRRQIAFGEIDEEVSFIPTEEEVEE